MLCLSSVSFVTIVVDILFRLSFHVMFPITTLSPLQAFRVEAESYPSLQLVFLACRSLGPGPSRLDLAAATSFSDFCPSPIMARWSLQRGLNTLEFSVAFPRSLAASMISVSFVLWALHY